MAKEIIVDITIDGNKINHFSTVTISQRFNAHHVFTLVLPHDAVEKLGSHSMQTSQKFIGKAITICFGDSSTIDNIFKGIITEVGMQQSRGLWGNIVLTGYSPTYLLESGPHNASYYKKNLSAIVSTVMENLPLHDMQLKIKPKTTTAITYTTQYRESHFNFINRLSAEYGEWLYYNGEELFFGKPNETSALDLLYGADIEDFSFSMRIVPTNVNHYSYNSDEDNLKQSTAPASVNGANDFMKQALKASDALYQNPVIQPVAVRTPDKKQLDDYAKKQKAMKAANTVLLNATGDNPKLRLGGFVTIKVIEKEIKAEETPEHGEYLVTSVTHNITGIGEYSHTFEAIPSGCEVIPVQVNKPLAETQMAIVKDNNDPKKMGRVRVQMLWQQESVEMTDWIRVLTPDAGSSDKVEKNRGFVFVPEVGDQVLLGFRYNDPDRPFVLGSMFHGKTGNGCNDDNHSKSLTTRSGNKIVMDDKKGSVIISDPSGNVVTMHGDGSMTIQAPKKIKFVATDIEMNAANSINLTAKPDKDGGEGTISLIAQKNLEAVSETQSIFITSKEQDVNLEAKVKNVNMKAKEELKVEGKKVSGKATEKMLLSGGGRLEASSADSNFI